MQLQHLRVLYKTMYSILCNNYLKSALNIFLSGFEVSILKQANKSEWDVFTRALQKKDRKYLLK